MVNDPAFSRRSARLLDEYIVVAAQTGDRSALDQMVRRWHRKLVAHAWRLTGDRDVAEEVTQSAWLEILRGLAGLRDERAFPAWVYRIVTRQAARRIGRMMEERTVSEELGGRHAHASGSDLLQTAEGDRLRTAVASLSPAHRAAVALHYFEQLSVAEIAVALDVPAGTIKTRLMHARERLRAQFKGEDDA